MKHRNWRYLLIIVMLCTALQPSYACVPYNHSTDFPEKRPKQIPIFHSIVDDKALVMFSDVKEIAVNGGVQIERRQVFNFAYCDRMQRFRRGQEELYPKIACVPLSNMWIPVVDPDDPEHELISTFSEYVVRFLRRSLDTQMEKIDGDQMWVLVDGALQRQLLSMFVISTFVMTYKMAPPMTRMGRWSRSGLRAASVLTLLGIGFSIYAEMENEAEYETIYDRNLQELNAILNSLDGELRYYSDATPNRPIVYVFEEVNKAISQSMDSILYNECGFM